MKHILQVLAVVLILSATAYAAYDFQYVANQAVEMADDAAQSFPAGDFSMGGWFYWNGQSGNKDCYFFSWGDQGAFPSMTWFIASQDRTTGESQIYFEAYDADGDAAILFKSVEVFAFTTWYHVLVVHTGGNTVLYVNGVADPNDRDDYLVGSGNGTYEGTNVADDLVIGWRWGENLPNKFDGRLAYWAKWDRVLTSDERTNLATGCDPTGEGLITGLAWYLPMEDFGNEQIGNIVITEDIGAALIVWDGTTISQCGGDGVPLPAIISIDKSGGKSNFKQGGKQ